MGVKEKVLVSLHLDAHGRRFDGAVLQLQIPAATDSRLVLAYSIYDGRRKASQTQRDDECLFLFNPESQEESRWQAERLPSHISET